MTSGVVACPAAGRSLQAPQARAGHQRGGRQPVLAPGHQAPGLLQLALLACARAQEVLVRCGPDPHALL